MHTPQEWDFIPISSYKVPPPLLRSRHKSFHLPMPLHMFRGHGGALAYIKALI
jgi:hypothetical protein